MMKASQNIYPNFLYIGASKAGSSWLYECLREHPQVFVPAAKDLHFFHIHYDKGMDWYRNFFKPNAEQIAIGELSHDYFLFPDVAQKIYECNPKMKLIVSLREPVDKTISGYQYAQKVYLDKSVSFEDFFYHHDRYKKTHFQNMNRETANYFEHLQAFYKRFPRKQILILFFDELKSNPQSFLQKVYNFLEVDADFTPSVLHQKVNQQQAARLGPLAHLAYKVAEQMRKMGLANIVGAVKRNALFNKLLYQENKQEAKWTLEEEMKHTVYEYFVKDYAKLSELIKQDLPANWYLYE